MTGRADVEIRTLGGRDLDERLLAVEALHGDSRVQTVARIEGVSTKTRCRWLDCGYPGIDDVLNRMCICEFSEEAQENDGRGKGVRYL